MAKTKKITDKIKSLQDALDYNGETLEQFNWRTERDTPGQKAGKALEAIALALNEGKELENSERWYYPWFYKAGSASGFSYYDFYFDRSSSYVGARLCVKTSDLAIYMGKNFLSLYDEYINSKETIFKPIN